MCIYIFNSQNNLMKYILRIRKHFSDEETGRVLHIIQLKGIGIGPLVSLSVDVYFPSVFQQGACT